MSTADSSTVPRPPPPAADAVSGPGLQQQRVLRRAVPRNVNGRMQYMTAAAGARPQMVRPPGTSPLLMRAPPPPVPQRVKILRTLKDATLFAAAIFIIFFANSRFGLVGACLVGTILLKMGFFSLLDSVRATFAQTFGTSHLAMQESLRRADVMSEPIRAKSSEFKRGYNFSYGFSCMQGWRRGMEDDHTMTIDPDEKTAFFGVFDGHCGQTVATYCGKHLFTFVKNASKYSALDFPHALKEGFTALDKHIFKTLRGERSGCTAVTLLMKTNDQGVCKLYCANAGDSRCIISRDGAAHPLSEDHKPDLPKEHQRIQNAGGFVARSRVNGSLALSRAIGDFSFKTNSTISWEEQAVTSDPDVTEWEIKPTDEFIVLACDGIWDVKTNDEVITFVRDRLKRNIPLDKICEEIMEDCLAPTPFGLGCDNMSVIIITLNGNGTVDRYRDPSLKKPEIKAVETPAAEPLKVEVETAEVKEEALEVEEETPATPVSDSPEIMSPSTVQATTAFPTGNSSADDEDDGM